MRPKTQPRSPRQAFAMAANSIWCECARIAAMGYRFRLHRKDLPGCPDLVFRSRRKVIFIHGCFWHGHPCPRGARMPVQNRDYWSAKIARNKQRDEAAQISLKEHGWQVLVIWECELKDARAAMRMARRFLGSARAIH
jgi:DNA mismatch endonuclease, patch repair protein